MKQQPVILIVDDEQFNLSALERLLHGTYQVVSAANGAAALEQLAAHDVDLVITDVMMPVMDGFELVRRIRSEPRTRLLPVVIVTGLAGPLERVKGIDAGCDDFISKPFDQTEILARVSMLLKMDYYRSQLNEKEKFERMVDEMDEGIVICDRSLAVTRFNHAAGLLLAMDPSAPPAHIPSHLTAGFLLSFNGDLAAAMAAGPCRFEIERVETPAVKALVMAATTHVIRGPAGELDSVILTVRDVTAQRKDDIIKRDFIGLISHKLRTPLAVLFGTVQLLRDNVLGELNAKQTKNIDLIMQKLKQLNEVIDRLIAFADLIAYKEELGRSEVSLEEYLRKECDMHSSAAEGKKVRVEYSFANEGTLVHVNRVFLDQIVRNIMDNAAKFCDKKELVFKVAVRREGGSAVVTFADNGPGIPPEEQKKIFEAFYQVEKYFTGNVKGVGVGLALVKRFVEAHGGTIAVESAIGKGAAFIVTLPAVP
ncbi:MAG TPA: hybrid sensor histidine kinase/response regulator [bacterium]|nr:hybrid sensor histidine kinase/response regulator [bacterium]